jgi:hypothetical protein
MRVALIFNPFVASYNVDTFVQMLRMLHGAFALFLVLLAKEVAMHIRWRGFELMALIVVVPFALHCGATKSGQEGESRTQTRFDFGRSNERETLINVIVDVLLRNTYQLRQVGSTADIIETEWAYADPTQLDLDLNITGRRHRLTAMINHRKLLSTASLRLYYEAQHGKGEWVEAQPEPELLGLIETMQREVKQRLNQTVFQ